MIILKKKQDENLIDVEKEQDIQYPDEDIFEIREFKNNNDIILLSFMLISMVEICMILVFLMKNSQHVTGLTEYFLLINVSYCSFIGGYYLKVRKKIKKIKYLYL